MTEVKQGAAPVEKSTGAYPVPKRLHRCVSFDRAIELLQMIPLAKDEHAAIYKGLDGWSLAVYDRVEYFAWWVDRPKPAR